MTACGFNPHPRAGSDVPQNPKGHHQCCNNRNRHRTDCTVSINFGLNNRGPLQKNYNVSKLQTFSNSVKNNSRAAYAARPDLPGVDLLFLKCMSNRQGVLEMTSPSSVWTKQR